MHGETTTMAASPRGGGNQGLQPIEREAREDISTDESPPGLIHREITMMAASPGGSGAQGIQPIEREAREDTELQTRTAMPPSSTSTGCGPQATGLTTPAVQELQATRFPTMMAQAAETALRGAAVGARVLWGISSLANAALTWDMPTGFEGVVERAEMITRELTQESTMGDDIWNETRVLGTKEIEMDGGPEATTDTETQGSETPRRPERRPASVLGDDMESAAKRLREMVDRRTWYAQSPVTRPSCDGGPPSMPQALGRGASTKTIDSSQSGNGGSRDRLQAHGPNPGLNSTRTTIPPLPRAETDRAPLILTLPTTPFHTSPTVPPVRPPTRVVFNGRPIKMTSQEIRALMEELLKPMQDKLESLEKAQGSSLEVRMEHRKIALEARKRNADEELRAIADKTWY